MSRLREDALRIWQAGLEAVRSERLMKRHVRVEGRTLVVISCDGDDLKIDLNGVRRIAVVGAGKAGAGMAAALEETLGPEVGAEKHLTGWVNVPADCVRKLQRIHLHAARPPGINEPTAEGIAGTEEILQTVSLLGSDDLCIALISGGGSALLPAPIEGISLADKLTVTRFLGAAGANIAELNTVRKQLSRIKGGGLARACRAGRLLTLIVSDIPGNPLDMIASGPTVPSNTSAKDAIAVLKKFGAAPAAVPATVLDALNRQIDARGDAPHPTYAVTNLLIGSNEISLEAAAQEAKRLGHSTVTTCASQPEGAAELLGQHLASAADFMRTRATPNCLISGGEATVKLVPEDERGLGGRNQQTVLAALIRLIESKSEDIAAETVILSAGTDGEDGPTDAAGAFVDSEIIAEAQRRGLDPADYLRRNDAYHFFEPLGALIKTGPTHTNVCDLRIVLVDRSQPTAP
jgi:hydroxypyruvate reductase